MTGRDPVLNLLHTYNDLNPNIIDELFEEPSPLEFLRYVAQNRPFVIRGAAKSWTAVRKWDAQYLRNALDGKDICVAVTPTGNADAIVEQEDRSLIFVQPYEISKRFSEFLDYVQHDSKEETTFARNVHYAQTQNDNLRNEYSVLFTDVPSEIDFARIGLNQDADAVNFWLGNQRSITSLHKDNYENVYVQVRGQKHFALLPPVAVPCLNERLVAQGRYVLTEPSGGLLQVKIDDAAEHIPVPTWDPDYPEARATAYSPLAEPLRVTLEEGDMLYLPAMWFHKVSQSVGKESFALAVNYWYDMDFSGGFWATNSFVRDVIESRRKEVSYPSFVIHDDS